MSGRLVRQFEKNRKVKQGRDPEDEIKDQRAKKFREHHLPVTDRRRHQRLDRAELKFLRKQAHCDKGKNQNEREPEEDRVKKSFLDGVLHLPLVHEGNLKIKIHPADEQKKNHDDIGDRRVEVAAYFAGEQSIKFMHWESGPLNDVGMRELDEDILERRSTLSQFAHRPMAVDGKPKNLFAHINT
jgi:hypothetical protein